MWLVDIGNMLYNSALTVLTIIGKYCHMSFFTTFDPDQSAVSVRQSITGVIWPSLHSQRFHESIAPIWEQ